jgi:mannan endo-1,4-beta-mannosidase
MRKKTVVLMAATGVFVVLFAQWRINSQTLSWGSEKENLTNPLPDLTPQVLSDLAAQEPANPNLSAEAREVLRYLYSLPDHDGNRVLSGQTIWEGYDVTGRNNHPSTYGRTISPLDRVADVTGQWPAIISTEYSDWRDTPSAPQQRVRWRDTNPILIDYWQRGGLVEIHYHPKIGDDRYRQGDTDPNTGRLIKPRVGLEEILEPGGSLYADYMAALDEVVAGLRDLQDHGVVVLWRPIHAAHNDNYRPFWWTGDPDRYRKVWVHMFEYFKSRGINNLIWMQSWDPGWNYQNNYPPNAYYVGAKYVDVIGIENGPHYTTSQGYQFVSGLGKPLILSEVWATWGNWMDVINMIRNSFPRIVGFIAFSLTDTDGESLLGHSNGGVLLADPWVANRGEISILPMPAPGQ